MGLRNYQIEDQQAIKAHWERGERRLLGVQATGLGKTKLFSTIYNVIPKRKKMLILVNREELIRQTAKTVAEENPGFFVGIEQAENRHSPFDDVVVASIQTIGTAKKTESGEPVFNKRILTLNPDEFDVVVADECLTGDSMIHTDIGLLSLSNPLLINTRVLSYSEILNLWEFKSVKRWIPKGKKSTITVRTQSAAIRCTPEHLIMTQRGWVEASSLTTNDSVQLPVSAGVAKQSRYMAIAAFLGNLKEAILRALPRKR